MKKIILDLYNGNYSAFERRFAPNCEQTKALNRVVELEEEVQKTIPAEYQPLIKAYGDALGLSAWGAADAGCLAGECRRNSDSRRMIKAVATRPPTAFSCRQGY